MSCSGLPVVSVVFICSVDTSIIKQTITNASVITVLPGSTDGNIRRTLVFNQPVNVYTTSLEGELIRKQLNGRTERTNLTVSRCFYDSLESVIHQRRRVSVAVPPLTQPRSIHRGLFFPEPSETESHREGQSHNTHTHSQACQSHICADGRPWITPRMEKGIRETLAVSPFFFYSFPLFFWSGTKRSGGGTNVSGWMWLPSPWQCQLSSNQEIQPADQ